MIALLLESKNLHLGVDLLELWIVSEFFLYTSYKLFKDTISYDKHILRDTYIS